MSDCTKNTNCEYKARSLFLSAYVMAQQALWLQKVFAAHGFPKHCLWEMSTNGVLQGGLQTRANHAGFVGERNTRLSLHHKNHSSAERSLQRLRMPQLAQSVAKPWCKQIMGLEKFYQGEVLDF